MSAFAEAQYVIDELTDVIESGTGTSALQITTHTESWIGKTVTVTNGIETVTGVLANVSGAATPTGYCVIKVHFVGAYNVTVEGTTSVVAISSIGEVKAVDMDAYKIYAFHADGDITDPSTKVTYPSNCQNAGFTPVHVDLTTGLIDGGDWFDTEVSGGKAEIKNAPFFFPRSCMLKSNGTVDYYLNELDESKKENGTASDYNNSSYDGNAMVEFGQNDKIIYFKIVPDSGVTNAATIYISDKKVDNDYKDYAFRDKNGNLANHFYLSKYFGSGSATKMRSISGMANYVSDTAANEITAARANGADIWDTTTLAQWNLVNFLLILMAKSTNTQAVYGTGRCKSTNTGAIAPGTMDGKGMFWGSSDEEAGVKVFGMENWWGNIWRRIRGYINDNGTTKVKLTRGTTDGSVATDYNTDGTGYLTISDCTPSGTSGGYISEMKFTEHGMFAKTASGSDTTHYCDGLWFNNAQSNYALVGGDWIAGSPVGALCLDLTDTPSYAGTSHGSALSCTPLGTAP